MPVPKDLPFEPQVFERIGEEFGTPVFVYDEFGIRNNARRVNDSFSDLPGYQNYFAVKASPTPGLLRVIHSEGMGFDCSSRPELLMVANEGLGGNGVFYTSNNTPDEDYSLAREIGAIINIDKRGYMGQMKRVFRSDPPHNMAIRYNPGELVAGSSIIGVPAEAKFGAREDQVLDALAEMKAWGVRSIGLHTMVVSNEKDPEKFALTARLLRELAEKALTVSGVNLSFINIGGGLGVNYHPDEEPVEVEAIGDAVVSELGGLDIPIVSEHGRFITGPNGYLLTRVTHGVQQSHRRFLEIDTSVNNMARLATVKAAYHEIHVLGREADPTVAVDITGSMCANTDIMFRDRQIPETVAPGDLVVIHDAGAHSRANSHNYNGRLRAGEVLVRRYGSPIMIRRPETDEDYFATSAGL